MPRRTRISRSIWQNGKRVVTFFARGHVPKQEPEHFTCPMCEKHICQHSKPMMVEHQERLIADERASTLKEARKELVRLSNQNRDYDWVVREFDGWITSKLRKKVK